MSTVRAFFDRLRRDFLERWDWYRQQQRVPRQRRWWDAYNS